MLCWFLVSSLASLIGDNDHVNDRCVWVNPSGSGSGLGLGFTADDRRLGLHSRQQVGVRVRVSSSRQGLELGLAPFARGRSTASRGAHATRKAVRMPNKPETEVNRAHGTRICLVRKAYILLGYISLCNPVVTATGLLSGVRISFDDHSAH